MRPASSSPGLFAIRTLSGKSRYETLFNEASALLPEETETNCPTCCAMGHSVLPLQAFPWAFALCHRNLRVKAHWLPACSLFQ